MSEFQGERTHVFYINLDTRPDRRKKMESQFSKFKINANRIPAINAESARLWAEIKGPDALDLRTANNLSTLAKTSHMDIDGWGAVGCFQSHISAWKKILEMGLEKAWILEDDAIIKKTESISVSSSAPLVWLGLRGTVNTKPIAAHLKTAAYPYPELDYDRTQYGAHAYCIHSSLLPLLLSHAEKPLGVSVDFFINEVCLAHKIYVGYHDLCKTNEFLSYSDIDHFPLITNKRRGYLWKGAIAVLIAVVLCIIFFAI
jgi:GR25 family glycosyltransferase involved in LPS biosynthesis